MVSIGPRAGARKRGTLLTAAAVLVLRLAGCGTQQMPPLPSSGATETPLPPSPMPLPPSTQPPPLSSPSSPLSVVPPSRIVPTGPAPFAIAQGTDGNLWFTEFWAHRIGRITTQGGTTPFELN